SSEQAFAPFFPERGCCAVPTRGGVDEERVEFGISTQWVELVASLERRGDPVALRHRTFQQVEPQPVLPNVAEEASLLEDRFRILSNLQSVERRHPAQHVWRPFIEPCHQEFR